MCLFHSRMEVTSEQAIWCDDHRPKHSYNHSSYVKAKPCLEYVVKEMTFSFGISTSLVNIIRCLEHPIHDKFLIIRVI